MESLDNVDNLEIDYIVSGVVRNMSCKIRKNFGSLSSEVLKTNDKQIAAISKGKTIYN